MNITFMVVTTFLFFFGLIFLGKLIISGYVTYLLSVKFGDEYITSQMKRDIYIFGIVADLAAIGLARHQRQPSDTAGLRLVFAHRPPTQPVFVLWRDVGLVAVADFFVCAHGDECHRWHARA